MTSSFLIRLERRQYLVQLGPFRFLGFTGTAGGSLICEWREDEVYQYRPDREGG